MKVRLALLFIFLIVAASVIFRKERRQAPVPATSSSSSPTVEETAPSAESTEAATSPARIDLPATPVEPRQVEVEFDNVKLLIRDYRLALGENPVGSNAEITKALMGANSKKTKFAIAGETHLNQKGELVDPWRTPYFFHQLSGREMEIRSAGPDRQMWTGDDIVLR